MPRFAFRVEYLGTPFNGWQRQEGQPSVQQAIEQALARIEPVEPRIAAAGRTDTGVHATGQVAHADLARDWSPERLMEAVNHHLKPLPVALTACARVTAEFHARFSAVERRYTFRLVARRAPVVRDSGLVWQVRHRLDLVKNAYLKLGGVIGFPWWLMWIPVSVAIGFDAVLHPHSLIPSLIVGITGLVVSFWLFARMQTSDDKNAEAWRRKPAGDSLFNAYLALKEIEQARIR